MPVFYAAQRPRGKPTRALTSQPGEPLQATGRDGPGIVARTAPAVHCVTMEPTKELADEIYRERILRARAMLPEQKLLAGIELFRRACEIMADGIRSQFPEADEARVQQILRERLHLLKKLEGSR